MSRNGEPEAKRVRQACLNCRRKKTRCPGERPACAFCVRLGQACRYADAPSAATISVQHAVEKDFAAAHSSLNTGSSFQAISFPSAIGESSTPFAYGNGQWEGDPEETERPMPVPQRLPQAMESSSPILHTVSRDIANQAADRATRFEERPPEHVIAKLTDVYFSNCQNQPYCLFHEANMRRRLQIGDLPEHLLLAFAATAARYSRDDYFKPDPLVAVASYAKKSWAILKNRVLDGDPCTDLDSVQAPVLLAIIDFVAGRPRQGWVKTGLAIRFVQDLKLNAEPDASIPVWQQEERRRVFWSVYLLDSFFACGRSWPVSIVDSDCTVRLPCVEESFRLGSHRNDAPTLAVLDKPWQSETAQSLDNFAISALTASLLGRTVKISSLEDIPTVPCWDPQSGFAKLSSLLMSFESRHATGSENPTQHINELYGTYEGYDRQRVGSFTVQHTGCCARGSSLGYIAACIASIHKLFLHSPDENTVTKAAEGLETCLKFLEHSHQNWAHLKPMKLAINEFNIDPALARLLVDSTLPATIEMDKAQRDILEFVLDYVWLSDVTRAPASAIPPSDSSLNQGDWNSLLNFDGLLSPVNFVGGDLSPEMSQHRSQEGLDDTAGLLSGHDQITMAC
ncbi:unnamed protein product [Cercospora beticola]|nr:unnamed protein product [Cercospora beticola]